MQSSLNKNSRHQWYQEASLVGNRYCDTPIPGEESSVGKDASHWGPFQIPPYAPLPLMTIIRALLLQ